MATENYGVTASLTASQASTPVSTETLIVFVGDSVSTNTNQAFWFSSMSEYEAKLGSAGTLYQAARCSFDLVGIRGAYFISATKSSADATSADLIAAIEAAVPSIFTEHGDVVTIGVVLGGPSVVTANVVNTMRTALNHTIAGDEKFYGMVYYDGDSTAEDNDDKKLGIANKYCVCNVDDVIVSMSEGSITEKASGAAYKACLLALADYSQEGQLPCRCVGNLPCPNILGICNKNSTKVSRTELEATELSADGITSWRNAGGGKYYTWGDHTSLFANGSVDDEAGRFDSNMRMANHLCNRQMLKYKGVIDAPMTPQIKNDILTAENNYLAYCVSVGALIGSPVCEFRASENTTDTLQQGEFYFSELATVTPPAKYIDFKLTFNTDGFKIYLLDE